MVAAHGRHAFVETAQGKRVQCHLRGRKADLVVGDLVRWQPAGDEGVIEQVEPRRNLLFRQDEWKTKSFAANLDQLLILVAVEPVFSESQLTRSLIAAESAGIRMAIALNKTDLPGTDSARERLEPYRAMGLKMFEVALKAGGFEVFADHARAGRERGLDPRLYLEPALDRFPRDQPGCQHDPRVGSIRA